MLESLPLLLPSSSLPQASTSKWQPKRHLLPPQKPPVDEGKELEMSLALARQSIDGKAIKKTRPRRTVDYGGGMGRYILVRRQVLLEYPPLY